MLLLELQDRLLDLERQLPGMPVGPSGAISEPLDPAVLVTAEDLVAGLAGDLELPTQPGHLLPVQQTGHKPQALVHRVTLPPRHLRTLRKCRKVSPMSPEYCVTYVSERTKRLYGVPSHGLRVSDHRVTTPVATL